MCKCADDGYADDECADVQMTDGQMMDVQVCGCVEVQVMDYN